MRSREFEHLKASNREIDGIGLIDNYFTTERYHSAQEFLEANMKHYGSEKYRDKEKTTRFVGTCFEGIGYQYLLGNLRQNEYLCPPEETFQFFQEFIYPQRRIVFHEAGIFTFRGTYIPDGLLIEGDSMLAGRVKAMVDYTMGPNIEVLERKLRGLDSLRKDTPTVFTETKLIVVAPMMRNPEKVLRLLRENNDLNPDEDLLLVPFPCFGSVIYWKIKNKYINAFEKVFKEKF